MGRTRDQTPSRPWIAALEAHGVYMSDADEAEIIRRAAGTHDVGSLALRTCLCGARIDGFDAYWEHLDEALRRDSAKS